MTTVGRTIPGGEAPNPAEGVEGRAPQRRAHVSRWRGMVCEADVDSVAAEDPLQILVNGSPLGVVMRTPGHDLELALGLLHGEGLLRSAGDVVKVRIAPGGQHDPADAAFPIEWQPLAENLVDVQLREQPGMEPAGWQRHLVSASACGICGATTIEALEHDWPPVPVSGRIEPGVLYALPDALRCSQAVFAATGGLHAAGLFSLTGELICLREDVGRHNAVDKIVGRGLLAGDLPLQGCCLMLSGRAGFEILQKAAAAGLPVVAAVSAPSSLAVETASRFGVTLVGFLRGEGMNVYSVPERVAVPQPK